MKRKIYPPEFKAKAVALAKEVGAIKAADQLKLAHGTIYHWLDKAGVKPPTTKAQKSAPRIKRKYTRKQPKMEVIPAAPAPLDNIVVIVTKPSALRSVLEQLGHE